MSRLNKRKTAVEDPLEAERMDEVFLSPRVNYRKHPSDNKYTVFFFTTPEEGLYFEERLDEEAVVFEKDSEDTGEQVYYLYVIKNNYFKQALNANFLTKAKFRKPFLPKIVGVLLVLITFGLIVMAIIGSLYS